VRLQSDIIAVTTTPGAQAAKSATRTIPIVMLSLGDPVGAGLVRQVECKFGARGSSRRKPRAGIGRDHNGVQLLHRWFDTWNGIGSLPWECTGRACGCLSATSRMASGGASMGNIPRLAPEGYGVAPTPWRAVQVAAWQALHPRSYDR
jgi:hypothetical protein